jgi:hypothetical protein
MLNVFETAIWLERVGEDKMNVQRVGLKQWAGHQQSKMKRGLVYE